MNEGGKKRPFLEHLEAYLARRDGVDKALKVLRYSSKVWLATPWLVRRADLDVVKRVRSFEASVGTSRKAFRLGKFIQDVNSLRRAPSVTSRDGVLEVVATTGEGVYYFVEQFVWLVSLPRRSLPSALFGPDSDVRLCVPLFFLLFRPPAAALSLDDQLFDRLVFELGCELPEYAEAWNAL